MPHPRLAARARKATIDRMALPGKLPLLITALAAAVFLAPSPAAGQTCWLTTGPTAVAFGVYNPGLGTPTDSTGSFLFDCDKNVRATVTLSAGAGTYATRQMSFGADRLNYNLYRDAARTQIWGDGTAPSTVLTNARRRTTYTIYGRIPVAQYPRAGGYSDTITLSVIY